MKNLKYWAIAFLVMILSSGSVIGMRGDYRNLSLMELVSLIKDDPSLLDDEGLRDHVRRLMDDARIEQRSLILDSDKFLSSPKEGEITSHIGGPYHHGIYIGMQEGSIRGPFESHGYNQNIYNYNTYGYNDRIYKGYDLDMIKNLTQDEKDFFMAVLNDDVKKVDGLLKKGVNINVQDDLQESVLTAGIKSKSLNAIQFLVDQGIDVNMKGGIIGNTSIHFVVVNMMHKTYKDKKTSLDVLKTLLAQNASYDIKNDIGNTALSTASKDSVMESIFDEIIKYKNSVKKEKVDALVNAITHNGKNDSQFTKEQWLRLGTVNK